MVKRMILVALRMSCNIGSNGGPMDETVGVLMNFGDVKSGRFLAA